MISLLEARQIISGAIAPKNPTAVPLSKAKDRVLSKPVLADVDYPDSDRATMDGYATLPDESATDLSVAGELRAGAIGNTPLASGQAIRIFTGATLPPGAGQVIPQEQVERSGDRIRIVRPEASNFIRRRGEEARAGDIVLPRNTFIGAAELAVLAQMGVVAPEVVAPPVIRHLATGDELVSPSETPTAGAVRDSNSTLIASLASDWGLQLASSQRARDSLPAIADFLNEPADLYLLSGGASVGDYDLGAKALERAGFDIHFRQINLRPGKPLTFGTRGTSAAFVLPGNPVAHFVCWHLAVKLALNRFLGLNSDWNLLDLDLLEGSLPRFDSRETFCPAKTVIRNGSLGVIPKPWSTSGNTFALIDTNSLVRIDGSSTPEKKVSTLIVGKLTAA